MFLAVEIIHYQHADKEFVYKPKDVLGLSLSYSDVTEISGLLTVPSIKIQWACYAYLNRTVEVVGK